ncbi:hypothetical protein A9995_14820 [Erythrobacter sp. QSSC1-22B]|uniref:hypothetical protein n=1 Tax=Erythrobacter sp. QSSC1-22B TaxID=1860125 RepID=UPI000805408B|nr:hypothetical protein [Erythrobacter sp. QSSC1-22B]OBX17783.1 hypothetical protein A9995_14820 [Erythrobacter sp. QSSC1-22B]
MTEDRTIPYERRKNPNLPWGYWLTAVGEVDGWPPLVDDEGNHWNSVREAFWVSRLAMGRITQSSIMHQELEFMLAMLCAIERRIIPIEERALDFFQSWDQSRFYGAFLHGQALLEPDPGSGLDTKLAPEAHAVILMLASTRSPEDAPMPIGLPTLRAYHGLNAGINAETRKTIIAAQERAAQTLQYRFQREQIGQASGIVLVGDALGPNVPLRRKLWSTTLPDPYARDRMYLWLHERIDRWPVWGELAYRRGARALSEHLMLVKFCDEPIELG